MDKYSQSGIEIKRGSRLDYSTCGAAPGPDLPSAIGLGHTVIWGSTHFGVMMCDIVFKFIYFTIGYDIT